MLSINRLPSIKVPPDGKIFIHLFQVRNIFQLHYAVECIILPLVAFVKYMPVVKQNEEKGIRKLGDIA